MRLREVATVSDSRVDFDVSPHICRGRIAIPDDPHISEIDCRSTAQHRRTGVVEVEILGGVVETRGGSPGHASTTLIGCQRHRLPHGGRARKYNLDGLCVYL